MLTTWKEEQKNSRCLLWLVSLLCHLDWLTLTWCSAKIKWSAYRKFKLSALDLPWLSIALIEMCFAPTSVCKQHEHRPTMRMNKHPTSSGGNRVSKLHAKHAKIWVPRTDPTWGNAWYVGPGEWHFHRFRPEVVTGMCSRNAALLDEWNSRTVISWLEHTSVRASIVESLVKTAKFDAFSIGSGLGLNLPNHNTLLSIFLWIYSLAQFPSWLEVKGLIWDSWLSILSSTKCPSVRYTAFNQSNIGILT